jgi:succinyl-CoA synthetase alpha subunit
MFTCSVILVLFVRGRAAWTNDFWLQLFAAAVIVSAAICFLAFRKGNMRLVGVSLGHLARVFLPQLVFMYIASAVAITAVALAVIYAITRSAQDALALAVLAGLWLSLWLAPGIASLTSWRKLRAVRGNDA